MATRKHCEAQVGKWIRFRTPYGVHQGVLERISGDQAIIVSPKQYVPSQLVTTDLTPEEVKNLDVALALGGYPGLGYPGGGYGRQPGLYGGWGFGWVRWAVSFLVIYLLFGLFLWW